MMLNMMLTVQHRFNPLHLYCRLVETGLKKSFCLPICKWYGMLIYTWVAWFSVIALNASKVWDRTVKRNRQRATTMKHITVLVTVIFLAGVGGGTVGLVFYALLNWLS
jgi:hypothetical protein